MSFFSRVCHAVAALVFSAAAVHAQPANDECTGAIPITAGDTPFDMAGATNSRSSSCDDPLAGPVPDVWFSYTAGAHGTAIVTTCGLVQSIFGTTITIYNNCQGAERVCNSNACGEGQSTVAFDVTAGQTYLIRLASADLRTPDGTLRITFVNRCVNPPPGAPANDCCSTATPVGNGSFPFTIAGATRDYAGSCNINSNNPDVWFNYTAQTTGFAKIRPAADAPADLGIAVLDGACSGFEIVCGGDFMWEGDTRQVVFPTIAGHHYLVRLQGVSAPLASGHITFAIAQPPVNDECSAATAIMGPGVFSFDNTLANDSGPDDGLLCSGFGGAGIAHDVWFRWTNTFPAGQDAVITLCGGTRVDTKMAVYNDGCPVGQPLDCNDDFCFLQSKVSFTPAPNASYLVRIGTWPGMGNEPAPDGKPGTFTIASQPTCSISPPPGAFIEPEPCGQSLNDGPPIDCSGPGQYTDIPAGAHTIFGTAPVLGDTPDQDMYRFTLAAPGHIVVTGTAEFPMLLAILDTQCPQNLMFRWRFPSQPCDDPSLNPIELDLDPGEYVIAVANTRAVSPCSAKNNYLLTFNAGPIVVPCPADVAGLGGTPGPDGQLTVDDVVFFLSSFFANNLAVADMVGLGGVPGPDGQVTVDDLVAFLSMFFAGCP